MFSKYMHVVATTMAALSSTTFAQRPKILALHGGGGSPTGTISALYLLLLLFI